MPMNIMNRPHQLWAPAKAESVAKDLNSDPDEDFEYKVVHCPKGTGLSFIEVYDEDGEFIQKF